VAGDTDDDPRLAAFCEREWPRLVGALSLYCGDPAVAEDLAQEALVRVVQRWHRLHDPDRAGAYAHRTALNLAHSYYRRVTAELRAFASQLRPNPGQPHLDDINDVIMIRRTVASLPHRQRAALLARYYLELSVEDAASLLGITPGSLRVLASRALATMRRRLGDVPTTAAKEVPNG
jgi:RNA polymerase sigma factor (sigma-70 family)